MRAVLAATVAASVVWCGLASFALGDPGPWRRTTPRAVLEEQTDQTLALRVPTGRAWGIESRPHPVEPGRAYRVGARLDVTEPSVRSSFLRVAFYARGDGRGRQGLVIDGELVPGGTDRPSEVEFVAPEWARSVKVRVLVRRYEGPLVAELPVHASVGPLHLTARPPAVILREVD
jgi:hypothetical protein